jgi:hypothetical protein
MVAWAYPMGTVKKDLAPSSYHKKYRSVTAGFGARHNADSSFYPHFLAVLTFSQGPLSGKADAFRDQLGQGQPDVG